MLTNRLKLKEKYKHIGFDFNNVIKESILKGSTYGVIVKNPQKKKFKVKF